MSFWIKFKKGKLLFVNCLVMFIINFKLDLVILFLAWLEINFLFLICFKIFFSLLGVKLKFFLFVFLVKKSFLRFIYMFIMVVFGIWVIIFFLVMLVILVRIFLWLVMRVLLNKGSLYFKCFNFFLNLLLFFKVVFIVLINLLISLLVGFKL